MEGVCCLFLTGMATLLSAIVLGSAVVLESHERVNELEQTEDGEQGHLQ